MAAPQLTTTQREPAVIVGTITAGATAVLALLVAFSVPLTADQRTAILGVVAVAAPLAAAFLTRPRVTPNAKVEAYIDPAGVMRAGEASEAPTGQAVPTALPSQLDGDDWPVP